ncbi:MAG: hypothetical protein JWO07_694 [Candidatus Saccharibacteria bacterium]|nr:hypothetical protein [Candidatus Saccharibacteria bacterium]
MPRRKLSEYQAKHIVTSALGTPYEGWEDARLLRPKDQFVVKVDQAVKKRFKNGLVGLNLSAKEVAAWIETTKQKGYDHFIVEPYREHDQADERYISLMQGGTGMHMTYSAKGGVDIEDNSDSLVTQTIDDATDWKALADKTSLSVEQLQALTKVFTDNYFTLLEINPYIVTDKLQLLDVAVEVDDAAALMVNTWSEDDIRTPPRAMSDEERTIAALNDSSPASFSFQVIDPNGSLFVLLSGGGASVTVCDEIYSAGQGTQLANYGEYSGSPTTEEAYIYTAAVLRTLLRSTAPKKALFIGGAVANFTDIAKTFAGVCKALEEYGSEMKKQGIKVVVRRGGPNQEKGLANIKSCLDKFSLTAAVYDQKTTIDAAVGRLLQEVAS